MFIVMLIMKLEDWILKTLVIQFRGKYHPVVSELHKIKYLKVAIQNDDLPSNSYTFYKSQYIALWEPVL
jgi:hypothetical protein